MKKQKIKYIVTNIYTGAEYETMAVSEIDAINNIHYKLYFNEGIWTEMDDYEAVSIISLKYSNLSDALQPAIDYLNKTWGTNDKRRDKGISINGRNHPGLWDRSTQ